MNHIDLFSGIGVFSLAAKTLGIETELFVEIKPFCQQVLSKNFPGIPIHSDITTFDGTPNAGTIDLITGGVPCPPFSKEGKQLASDDARNMFPDFFRIINEIKPKYFIIENVKNILEAPYKPGYGDGSFFSWVLFQVSSIGYDAEFSVVSSREFGLPHLRERVFIVANINSLIHTEFKTPWNQQIRKFSEKYRTDSIWRGFKPGISRIDARTTLKLDIGVKSGDSMTRRRREALGNSIALPCAITALKRVLYLESIKV